MHQRLLRLTTLSGVRQFYNFGVWTREFRKPAFQKRKIVLIYFGSSSLQAGRISLNLDKNYPENLGDVYLPPLVMGR